MALSLAMTINEAHWYEGTALSDARWHERQINMRYTAILEAQRHEGYSGMKATVLSIGI